MDVYASLYCGLASDVVDKKLSAQLDAIDKLMLSEKNHISGLVKIALDEAIVYKEAHDPFVSDSVKNRLVMLSNDEWFLTETDEGVGFLRTLGSVSTIDAQLKTLYTLPNNDHTVVMSAAEGFMEIVATHLKVTNEAIARIVDLSVSKTLYDIVVETLGWWKRFEEDTRKNLQEFVHEVCKIELLAVQGAYNEGVKEYNNVLEKIHDTVPGFSYDEEEPALFTMEYLEKTSTDALSDKIDEYDHVLFNNLDIKIVTAYNRLYAVRDEQEEAMKQQALRDAQDDDRKRREAEEDTIQRVHEAEENERKLREMKQQQAREEQQRKAEETERKQRKLKQQQQREEQQRKAEEVRLKRIVFDGNNQVDFLINNIDEIDTVITYLDDNIQSPFFEDFPAFRTELTEILTTFRDELVGIKSKIREPENLEDAAALANHVLVSTTLKVRNQSDQIKKVLVDQVKQHGEKIQPILNKIRQLSEDEFKYTKSFSVMKRNLVKHTSLRPTSEIVEQMDMSKAGEAYLLSKKTLDDVLKIDNGISNLPRVEPDPVSQDAYLSDTQREDQQENTHVKFDLTSFEKNLPNFFKSEYPHMYKSFDGTGLTNNQLKKHWYKKGTTKKLELIAYGWLKRAKNKDLKKTYGAKEAIGWVKHAENYKKDEAAIEAELTRMRIQIGRDPDVAVLA